ncbi:MAG TPA: hypothetical protein VKJ67_25880 [Methylomirabilota bacterium]|nr:hypothetical protein [Methylomirabilota bacterium]
MAALLVAGTGLACNSPEATRTRGGGPGADLGNHPRGPVELHAGARMYAGTPTFGKGIGKRALIGGTEQAGQR